MVKDRFWRDQLFGRARFSLPFVPSHWVVADGAHGQLLTTTLVAGLDDGFLGHLKEFYPSEILRA